MQGIQRMVNSRDLVYFISDVDERLSGGHKTTNVHICTNIVSKLFNKGIADLKWFDTQVGKLTPHFKPMSTTSCPVLYVHASGLMVRASVGHLICYMVDVWLHGGSHLVDDDN